jgi:hypothetical protein
MTATVAAELEPTARADIMAVAAAASTAGSWGVTTKLAALWLLENFPD